MKTILIITFALFWRNSFTQKNTTDKCILKFNKYDHPIIINEGDSTSYFDLYFEMWMSLESFSSKHDVKVYQKITTNIEFNPLQSNYIVSWYSEENELIQYIELDSLNMGSGNYYYLFLADYRNGKFHKGMKSDYQYINTEYYFSKQKFVNGKAEGEMIIFSFNAKSVVEYLYVNDKKSGYEFNYEYSGEILNLYDYFTLNELKNGINQFTKNGKTISFELRNKRILGNVILEVEGVKKEFKNLGINEKFTMKKL